MSDVPEHLAKYTIDDMKEILDAFKLPVSLPNKAAYHARLKDLFTPNMVRIFEAYGGFQKKPGDAKVAWPPHALTHSRRPPALSGRRAPRVQKAELEAKLTQNGLPKAGNAVELMLRLAIKEIERTGPVPPAPAPASAPAAAEPASAPAPAPAPKPKEVKDKAAGSLHGFDFTVSNAADSSRGKTLLTRSPRTYASQKDDMKGFCFALGLAKTKGGNEKKAALAERLTPEVRKEAAQLLSEYLAMNLPVRIRDRRLTPTFPDLLPPPVAADDPT